MAAASADRDAKRRDGDVMDVPCAKTAQTIYKGTAVGIDPTSHYAESFADETDELFAGMAKVQVSFASDDTNHGDHDIRLWKSGVFEMVYLGGDATTALLEDEVYLKDDQTVDEDVSQVTANVLMGRCVGVVSATVIQVKIDGYC